MNRFWFWFRFRFRLRFKAKNSSDSVQNGLKPLTKTKFDEIFQVHDKLSLNNAECFGIVLICSFLCNYCINLRFKICETKINFITQISSFRLIFLLIIIYKKVSWSKYFFGQRGDNPMKFT